MAEEFFTGMTLGELRAAGSTNELRHMELMVSLERFTKYIQGKSTLGLSEDLRRRVDVICPNFRAYCLDKQVTVTDERPNSKHGQWYFKAGSLPEELADIMGIES